VFVLNTTRSALLRLEDLWRRVCWPFIWLLPLSWLYHIIVTMRFYAYDWGLFKQFKSSVPVWIVGNLSIGGSGKTPLVMAVADCLKAKGLRVGIVSRGYGRKSPHKSMLVESHHKACDVGDEVKLIALKTQCPIAVAAKRSDALQLLTKYHELDLILSDDGLSHYALARDLEIICQHACDHTNQMLLPAGPYRDIKARGQAPKLSCSIGYDTTARLGSLYSLHDPSEALEWSILKDKSVVVVAGIAKPERFYTMLKVLSIKFTTVPLQDHGRLSGEQLKILTKTNILLMTEKDAVKYDDDLFAYPIYVVGYNLDLSETFKQRLQQFLPHN
jgi:tetraacyldisaccharide 4'-kinase